MNILPLPRSPFFCADEGRCLPELTAIRSSELGARILDVLAEVEIEFAALEQRLAIEQELLKLRLKQRCFAALAVHCPEATVLSPQSWSGELNSPAEYGAPVLADGMQQRPTRCSIKVFPMAPISPGGTSNVERRTLNVEGETSYPKGRW